MKNRKFMCMIFKFSSLQLFEDTLAVLSHGKLCKEHGYTYDQKWESDLLQNRQLRPMGSSRSIIEFYHNFFLDIADLSISLDEQIRELARDQRETIARMLRETAPNVFPNGWRTSQRTSRSKKYQHSQTLLMTQIWNVL